MRSQVLLALSAVLAACAPAARPPAGTSVALDVLQADEAAQLTAALLQVNADETLDARDVSHRLRALARRGAVNFVRPLPGGNGRSCATCHDPRDAFTLSPARVEARWQRLQSARRNDPNATDPLFLPVDADDSVGDFTLLTDHPHATHVTLSRAVSPLNMLRHTAPYQQDRSAATLEAQALAAVKQHMQPTIEPSADFLESVAEFQRHIFSSAKVRKLSAAIESGATPPDLDPPLSALEQRGKEKFDDFCARCHGGPAQVRNLENRIFPPFDGSTNPVSINLGVSNPTPAGFPVSPIRGHGFDLATQRFSVDLPDGTTVVLVSSDPGTVLTDANALEKVGGNQVFNRFDIPQLRGINQTAPYFHDHRAKTLEEVVTHYQAFHFFINVVRGFPLPQIPDAEIPAIVAYIRKAF
jgi:cytochrome c peroxidase